jgi:hypothetical protein
MSAKFSPLKPVILMILFCVEIWLIGETVEAEDNPEKQRKYQIILYITDKMLFANYLGSNAHIESLPLRHALLIFKSKKSTYKNTILYVPHSIHHY